MNNPLKNSISSGKPPFASTYAKASVDKKALEAKIWWQEPLNIFSRLSGWIILPLIIGTLLGRWLDRRYSSGTKWFLIVIGLAFIVSMVGLVIQAKSEFKKITPK